MTSVREALDVVGQAVSLKELAHHQRGAEFPLSLRTFVGALPPGRLHKKVIPLDALQRKFDTLFNQRPQPLLQFRLHGDAPGASTLSVLFNNPLLETGYDEENPLEAVELAGSGEVLTARDSRYRFVDVRSSSLSLDIVSRQPVIIEVGVHFETAGVEMDFEDASDIDFVGFILHLNLELGSDDGSIDLVGVVDVVDALVDSASVTIAPDTLGGPGSRVGRATLVVRFQGKEFQATGRARMSGEKWHYEEAQNDLRTRLFRHFLNIDVAVDVDGVPDGRAGTAVENGIAIKIFEALKKPETRRRLKQAVTRWLLGDSNFYVMGVSSDSQALTIDYVIPPGQLEPFPQRTRSRHWTLGC